MTELEDVLARLKNCKIKINEYINELKDNSTARKSYNDLYPDALRFSDTSNIPRTAPAFEDLQIASIEYLQKQIDFIEQVLNLDIVLSNKLNNQIKNLILRLVVGMEGDFNDEMIGVNLINAYSFSDYSSEFNSILILSKFAEDTENIILVGANGSGKTRLANEIKGNDYNKITVIPAQKPLLMFNNKIIVNSEAENSKQMLTENMINLSKSDDEEFYSPFYNYQYTQLILSLRANYFESLSKQDDCIDDVGELDNDLKKLNQIFFTLFPGMKFTFVRSGDNMILAANKNGEIYSINAMSEGEKVALFYILSVLLTEEDNFIVVDEPETYLNPSVSNMLWDLLIQERKDCQFVFITHSVEFVLSKRDCKVYWIKNFEPPTQLTTEEIKEDHFPLPRELLTGILGSKYPVLFIEGDKDNSHDYAIYKAILGSHFNIMPVGGHDLVVRNCKAMNAQKMQQIQCFGIIDSDNYKASQIQAYKKSNVYPLEVNEIEMLLVSDVILNYLVTNNVKGITEEKVSNFKNEFWDKANNEKNKIIMNKTIACCNQLLATINVNNPQTIEELSSQLQDSINDINYEEIYSKAKEEIEGIIDERCNYDNLLKVCNLRDEIIVDLANQFLCKDYAKIVKELIKTNVDIQCELRKVYFSELMKALNS